MRPHLEVRGEDIDLRTPETFEMIYQMTKRSPKMVTGLVAWDRGLQLVREDTSAEKS